jgi:hypothetical protein
MLFVHVPPAEVTVAITVIVPPAAVTVRVPVAVPPAAIGGDWQRIVGGVKALQTSPDRPKTQPDQPPRTSSSATKFDDSTRAGFEIASV